MKKPFTAYFKQSNRSLVRVSRRPFVPRYPMDYVLPENEEHYVGDGCQISYRWHDAFDVFIAELEVRFAHTDGKPLDIPVKSHLCDLHLVYQLVGHSQFLPASPRQTVPALTLPEQHHMKVYTPPNRAILRLLPDREIRYFTLAVVVPKSAWVTRHPIDDNDPLASLIHSMKAGLDNHHLVEPARLTPELRALLHLMLNLPSYPDMLMDDELNGPMVKLIHTHRAECAQHEKKQAQERCVEAARMLSSQLVGHYESGEPLTVEEVARALHVDVRTLNRWHKQYHQVSFSQHIEVVRLEHAKTLLLADISITDIALKMGYSSASNFTRSFRSQFGHVPSEYIKSVN